MSNDLARTFLESVTGFVESVPEDSSARPVKVGTVDALYNGTGRPKVLFDGETLMGVRTYPWVGRRPIAGDRVVLIPQGHGYVIVGTVDDTTLNPAPYTSLSTQNLDTITTPGFYEQTSSPNATLARNYPTTRAGTLWVLPGTQFHQLYFTRHGGESDARRIWVRSYSGSFGPWREIAQRGFDGVPWAQAINRVAVGSLAAGASVDIAVTFPAGRFTQPPMVMATGYGSRTTWQVTDGTITTSGCTLRGSNWTSGAQAATYVGWHAVQMTESAGAG